MRFPRTIQPELLDQLDATDPRAIQSRRDLRKLNVLMGTPNVLAKALRGTVAGSRLVELGSGDGTLLLRVAKRLGTATKRVRAVLVDRAPSISEDTRAGFDRVGWDVELRASDVFEWLNRPHPETTDVTIANLFLHHFHERELADLLRRASAQTTRFVACEPRRSSTALAGASFLRLLGCNDVTQHDATVSVRAGFRDNELSELWPGRQGWRLAEWRSGPFIHAFVAAQPGRVMNELRP